ncbi:unnamed protein product [Laminaria digitata]
MILKGVLDMTCAINISGMDLPKRILGRKLNNGVIGAAGCASALCVLYNSWPAAKQQQQQQQAAELHTEQASSLTTLVANGNGGAADGNGRATNGNRSAVGTNGNGGAVGAPAIPNGSLRH